MTQIFGYSIPLPSWLPLTIFFMGWVGLSFLVSHLFDKYGRRWAELTKTRFATLICRVREFVDQYYVQHDLRHRIFERFKKEGVEIPFPQRTIHLQQERF